MPYYYLGRVLRINSLQVGFSTQMVYLFVGKSFVLVYAPLQAQGYTPRRTSWLYPLRSIGLSHFVLARRGFLGYIEARSHNHARQFWAL